jgi:hypothetical protein
MDRREDQVIFVKQRNAGLIAGRIGRIKRDLCEKLLAAWVPRCNVGQLPEVGLTSSSVLIFSLQMHRIPTADNVKLGRPAGCIEAQRADGSFKIPPILSRRWRRLKLTKGPQWIGNFGDTVKQAGGGAANGALTACGNSAPSRSWPMPSISARCGLRSRPPRQILCRVDIHADHIDISLSRQRLADLLAGQSIDLTMPNQKLGRASNAAVILMEPASSESVAK